MRKNKLNAGIKNLLKLEDELTELSIALNSLINTENNIDAIQVSKSEIESLEKTIEFRNQFLKDEFTTLYHADKKFEYMNIKSIKIMLRLNLRYRFIPLHNFGSAISLNDLRN